MFYYLNITNLVLADKFSSGTFNATTAVFMYISIIFSLNFLCPTYSMFFLLYFLIVDRVGNF